MVIFDIKQKKDEKIQRMYNKAMRDIGNFFGWQWTKNKPIISIVYDRKTFDLLIHRKTENWVIAWADKTNIYFLDKGAYQKHSCHKYSDQQFQNTLRHEIAHAFHFVMAQGNMNPIWLAEGLAEYASGKTIPTTNKFSNFLKFYSSWKKEWYQESYCAVELLVKKFGKQKILKLIKSLSKANTKMQFNKLFKKIYGSNPTYKFFNELLK